MKAVNKEKILDMCERLFLQSGISDTGVADIAKAAGISKGTLYYHYPSKDAIIFSVADRYFIKTQEALEKLLEIFKGGVSLEDGIKTCLYVLKVKRTTEKMHYILMSYGIMKDNGLNEKFRERYNIWIQMIYEALEYHKPSENNKIYCHLIMALFDGLALKNLIGVNGVLNDIDTMVDFLKSIEILYK